MLFKKNKKCFSVIKLFRIVDYSEAMNFDSKTFIFETLLDLNKEFHLLFDDYCLNFGYKNWKTLNGFQKGLKDFPNSEIVDILCINDVSEIFEFTNFIINLEKNIPPKGVVEIKFSINNRVFNIEKIIKYLKRNEIFDYGYIVELSSDFDMSTESKIKKGLFGLSYSIKPNKIRAIWETHKYSMIKGFLCEIYPINFINQSHLEQEIIKKLKREEIGQFQKINSNLTKWSLNEKEIVIAKKEFKNTKYLLATQDAQTYFLNTSEALEYKKMTDIGLVWNSETRNYE